MRGTSTEEHIHEVNSSSWVPNGTAEKSKSASKPYKWKISWNNTLVVIYVHMFGIYGFYLILTSAKLATIIWTFAMFYCGIVGTTAGAHRLWSHKAYKAKPPLKILLMLLHTSAFQHNVIKWVRDHRVHHKFVDTDADPYNINRGFFFAHVGWLLIRKHPDVIAKGRTIDMSDLETDPILVWQRKYYYPLAIFLCYAMPTLVPWYFWNESLQASWYCAAIFRYMVCLNITWSVNSAAHTLGSKPYDRNFSSTDHFILGAVALGEGWHNYHHSFPWDYRMSELGSKNLDLTTRFINFFAALGLAYDLKTTPTSRVRARATRTGDGSRTVDVGKLDDNGHETNIWGWDDPDMTEKQMRQAQILNKVE